MRSDDLNWELSYTCNFFHAGGWRTEAKPNDHTNKVFHFGGGAPAAHAAQQGETFFHAEVRDTQENGT